MTKREITARAKTLHDELELLTFACAMADIELPLTAAAAMAVRDGFHTADEAAMLVDNILQRLIPQVEMMRAATKKTDLEILKPASNLILLN